MAAEKSVPHQKSSALTITAKIGIRITVKIEFLVLLGYL
jgi:hypothetical protein